MDAGLTNVSCSYEACRNASKTSLLGIWFLHVFDILKGSNTANIVLLTSQNEFEVQKMEILSNYTCARLEKYENQNLLTSAMLDKSVFAFSFKSTSLSILGLACEAFIAYSDLKGFFFTS